MRVWLKTLFATGALLASSAIAFAKCDSGEKVVRFGIANTGFETATSRLAKEVQTQFQRALNGRACIEIISEKTAVVWGKKLEALRENKSDIVAASLEELSNQLPRYRVFKLPMAFKDRFSLDKYFASQPSDYWEIGFSGLGLKPYPIAQFGFKQLAAKKPIFLPADVTGLKFRVVDDLPTREMMSVMKVTGQIVDEAELAAAVKDGRIEAQFSDWASMTSNKSAEAHAALVEANFVFDGVQVLGTDKWRNLLPPKLGKAVDDAIRDGISSFNRIESRRLTEAKSALVSKGRPVYKITNHQRNEWIKLFAPLWNSVRTTGSGRLQLGAVKKANR